MPGGKDARCGAVGGDIYGHTSDDTARAAVEALDAALGR